MMPDTGFRMFLPDILHLVFIHPIPEETSQRNFEIIP